MAPLEDQAEVTLAAAEQVLASGEGVRAGNEADPDFAVGVGEGGAAGEAGGGGMAVLIVYLPGQAEPARSVFWPDALPQTFVVPTSTLPGAKVKQVFFFLFHF